MIDHASHRSDDSSTVELEGTIHFPDGLLGFPGALHYRLADGPGQGLYWLLQADGSAGFLASDPFEYFEGYTLDLSPEQATRIGADDRTNVAVLAISVPNPDGPWTANLQGPVVINVAAGLGAQLVLPGSVTELRRPFSPLLASKLEVAV